ncbi:tyrosine-type recombinase/integrase [Sinorhizobium garamanticum]|uniref:tyrosine-type recombinase/integrase n=1 Tax=Sinorhizobium garamanticum TaxID=680247 RepID=UPI003CC89EC7
MCGGKVSKLLQTIPRAAHWRLASLPETLSPAQIDGLLASFDANLPSGRRAYSMVRCVTGLGLRCAEVVKLRIEDIDWRNGTVRIARSKMHFMDWQPLPRATGEAIADYVSTSGPRRQAGRLFVRHVIAFRRWGWDRCDPEAIGSVQPRCSASAGRRSIGC